MLVDTEGLVLKAKVHVANVVDQEGINHCLSMPRGTTERPDTPPRGAGSLLGHVEWIYVARKALRSASNSSRQSAHLSR